MGSLEEVTSENPQSGTDPPVLPRSASLLSTDFYQTIENNPSVHSHVSNAPALLATPLHSRQVVVSIRDNPCFGQSATNFVHNSGENTQMPNVEEPVTVMKVGNRTQNICDVVPHGKLK